MAIVGALARVEQKDAADSIRRIRAIEGVTTFSVDDPDRIGLIIESECLDEAHRIVTQEIPSVQGVLGAWPVYANTEDEQV